MQVAEARELRAAISEVLDPLYAARLGNIPHEEATERAVARLQEVDETLRGWLHPVTTRLWPELPPLSDAALRERIDRECGHGWRGEG